MAVDTARQGRAIGLRAAIGGACLVLAGLAAAMPPLGRATLGAAYASVSLALEDRLATGAAPTQTRIALGPFGRDVRLSGEIADGAAARLRALLDENPGVARIHLTSEGGLVDEAAALGDLVAARGLSTYVPDYCVSACTLAFVRGRERFLVTGGRLGFHAPYETGLFGQVFQADGEAARRAYVAAGVEAGFAAEAVAVAAEDLWVPEAARLLQARVVTQAVGTGRFPDSTLDDDPTPAGARAAILRNLPVLAGLEGVPGAVDRIAAWYLDAYRAGRPESETRDGLGRRAEAAVARVLRQADDATTVAAGRLLLRAMRAARIAGEPACAAIGADGNLVLALETLQGQDDAREARALLVRAAGHQAGSDGPASLPEPARPASEPPRIAGRGCDGQIRAYAHALPKPERAAAAALRALMRRGTAPVREASALP